MNHIFDKLWYGNSGMASSKPSAEQKEKMSQAINTKEILLQTLSKEQIVQLNQYEDMITAASNLAEEEAFVNGIRYGVKFILAILKEK